MWTLTDLKDYSGNSWYGCLCTWDRFEIDSPDYLWTEKACARSRLSDHGLRLVAINAATAWLGSDWGSLLSQLSTLGSRFSTPGSGNLSLCTIGLVRGGRCAVCELWLTAPCIPDTCAVPASSSDLCAALRVSRGGSFELGWWISEWCLVPVQDSR